MSYNFTNIFPDVRHYKLIDSTNTEAKRYLSTDYSMVPMWFVADEQNAGKGRMGSSWVSSNGNLFCSLVCPINWNLKLMPMLSALVAVSIHETLKFFLKESNEIKIKWPNDILIDNSKISGALIENIINGENKFSIIGIGININSSPKLKKQQLPRPAHFNLIGYNDALFQKNSQNSAKKHYFSTFLIESLVFKFNF